MKTKPQPIKMDGKSRVPHQELIELLRQKAPMIFTEDRIDPDKLKQAFGESVSIDSERYGLNWAGKSDCFRHIQEPTTATLKPVREESVDFDNTENIFIEGENLQVLKVLQKSYYGKIKMIYIDPPYNTGNDSFIYPDKFQESKEDYLQRVGDKDEEGNLTNEGIFRKNSRDNGHYHSNWLSMMYPRLFLARNLLRQDGVIFVSIDDNEVHNLRMIMNEIYGEDNFEGHIHWRRRHNQPNDPQKLIALVAEHILVYSKNSATLRDSGVGKLDITGKFSNPDNDPRGEWNSKPWKVGSNQTGSKYTIMTPTGKTLEEEWMGEKATFLNLLADNRIYFPNKGDGLPRKKIFKSERQQEGQCATNWFPHEQFGHNQNATDEFAILMGGHKNVFDNPKPVQLLTNLIRLANAEGEYILDFFAGSGTTAHAAMTLNRLDGGNRKCISVQLAEPCDEKSAAFSLGYKNISSIAKNRIKIAGEQIKKSRDNQLELDDEIDVGLKIFELNDSSFRNWRSDVSTEEELIEQMNIFIDNVKEESTKENIIYELILKTGLDLNTKVEKKSINDNEYFSLGHGKMIVCLEDEVNQTLVDAILKEKPEKVILLDKSFKGNDQLKTNSLLQLESAKIDFKVI